MTKTTKSDLHKSTKCKTSRSKIGQETQALRAKIRAELKSIEFDLRQSSGGEIERRSKALTALFKLTQAIDEHDAYLARLRAQKDKNKHTPYAQIRPPSPDEMRLVYDRLNRLYSRLRTAQDPGITDEKTVGDGLSGD